jgi:hypothetical protein
VGPEKWITNHGISSIQDVLSADSRAEAAMCPELGNRKKTEKEGSKGSSCHNQLIRIVVINETSD